MKAQLVLVFFLLLLFEPSAGQIFRFRLSANSGFSLGEPGNAEKNHPVKEELSYPGSRDFKSIFKPGTEMEVISPLTAHFELGLQFGYSHLAGQTPKAPLYNFFLSRYNPLPDNYRYPDKALIYDTKLLNTLLTARWYFLPPDQELNVFIKIFGGVAFVGTDFTFQDPYYTVYYDVGTLFTRGTRNSENPKMVGFNGGAGLGTTYRLTDKLDIYFDVNASVIHSDIVNGVPNFNYNPGGETKLKRTNSLSAVAQGNVGLVFSAIPDKRYHRSNFTRSGNMRKGLFGKISHSRPFNRRR